MYYLIVSIPDFCTLNYFASQQEKKTRTKLNLRGNTEKANKNKHQKTISFFFEKKIYSSLNESKGLELLVSPVSYNVYLFCNSFERKTKNEFINLLHRTAK